MRYLPNSAEDRAQMLRTTGHDSVEGLFEQIPQQLRTREPLRVPGPLSESEILEFFNQAAAATSRGYTSLLGAGAYHHYRPVTIDMLLSRGEFFTAYTPYQPELSQGTLQALFEFQTLVAQLTGMEVANASLYDGSTATNEAVLMAMRIMRRERIVMARTVHPEYRQVVETYIRNLGAELVEVAYEASGQMDLTGLEAALDDNTAAVVLQSPNFLGSIERVDEIASLVHQRGALLIVTVTEPLSLAVVKPPSSADIVCGEAQSFGVPVGFGGPYCGFLATKDKFVRQIPGRLVGETKDSQGRRGFVLTLVTREQFIRREKATSNICTSQSLCAIAATFYLCLLGQNGLRKLAEHNLAKAHYAARELEAALASQTPFTAPYFNEFVLKVPGRSSALLESLQKEGIIGGLELERFYPELTNHLLICVTEVINKDALDRMASVCRQFGSGFPSCTDSEDFRATPLHTV
jgi:glycine dehydrogenase subunit 1